MVMWGLGVYLVYHWKLAPSGDSVGTPSGIMCSSFVRNRSRILVFWCILKRVAVVTCLYKKWSFSLFMQDCSKVSLLTILVQSVCGILKSPIIR